MAESLKPCPFCGAANQKIAPRFGLGEGVVITCQGCTGRIWGHDEDDAIEQWNRRAPGPATAAMLAWIKEVVETSLRAGWEKHSGAEWIPIPMAQAFIAEHEPAKAEGEQGR